MAYKAEWSVPSLEARGFPKKDAIIAFSWGTSAGNSGGWSNNPAGSGQNQQNFLVTRNVDANSALLVQVCAGGTPIPQATVFLEKIEGNTTYVYATYAFENCSISSVNSGGSGGNDNPVESVGLTFEKVSIEYKKS